jgi:hypothetical protein
MGKILLGIDLDNEKIYLTKHTWDCDWYWGMGYLGNNNMHYHFEEYLDGKHFNISDVFRLTIITQNDWYKILEYFKQAYALKEAYEVYYRGGAHITSVDNGIQKDREIAAKIAADMEKILDAVWEYIGSLK